MRTVRFWVLFWFGFFCCAIFIRSHVAFGGGGMFLVDFVLLFMFVAKVVLHFQPPPRITRVVVIIGRWPFHVFNSLLSKLYFRFRVFSKSKLRCYCYILRVKYEREYEIHIKREKERDIQLPPFLLRHNYANISIT